MMLVVIGKNAMMSF